MAVCAGLEGWNSGKRWCILAVARCFGGGSSLSGGIRHEPTGSAVLTQSRGAATVTSAREWWRSNLSPRSGRPQKAAFVALLLAAAGARAQASAPGEQITLPTEQVAAVPTASGVSDPAGSKPRAGEKADA